MRLGLIDTGVTGGLDPAACFGAPGGDAVPDHGDRSRALIGERVPLVIAAVASADGSIDARALAAALDWLPTPLIAIPLGSDRWDPDVAAALDRARARGVTVLAAAGDSHPRPVMFPARHPGVLAVGATDRRRRLLPECNRFPRLALRAPGLVPGGRGSSIACVLAAVTLARAAATPGELP